jgi:malto-oligosyltrehalose trehalohydrolase
MVTGEAEGYYADFASDPSAFVARALSEGFAYQGEPSAHAGGTPRGAPSGHMPPAAFVDFLQNHDQTGNRAVGERLLTLAGEPTMRALSAILLLSPHIPLLFMGEEWGETRPFLFFSDFEGDLAEAVRDGRRREFAGFAAFSDPVARAKIPDPNDPATFEASRIDWSRADTPKGAGWIRHTQTLLALRYAEIVPRLPGTGPHCGRVLSGRHGLIAVDWRLDGAALRLRANFSGKPAPLPPAPGRVLHAGGGAEAGAALPPLGVLVTLDEGREPAP